jgi:predicted small secreted protein
MTSRSDGPRPRAGTGQLDQMSDGSASVWARRRGGKEMKRRMNLKRTGIVLCCLVAIVLSGCATARGVGQDTQSLGRSIEKNAQ